MNFAGNVVTYYLKPEESNIRAIAKANLCSLVNQLMEVNQSVKMKPVIDTVKTTIEVSVHSGSWRIALMKGIYTKPKRASIERKQHIAGKK